MVDKEGKSEQIAVEEAITPPISAKKKIDTVNKRDKSQAYNKTVDKPKRNKTDTVKSLDKSRYAQITDTENTVDKSGSIPRSNYSNKSTRIENSHKYIFTKIIYVFLVFLYKEKVYQVKQ